MYLLVKVAVEHLRVWRNTSVEKETFFPSFLNGLTSVFMYLLKSETWTWRQDDIWWTRGTLVRQRCPFYLWCVIRPIVCMCMQHSPTSDRLSSCCLLGENFQKTQGQPCWQRSVEVVSDLSSVRSLPLNGPTWYFRWKLVLIQSRHCSSLPYRLVSWFWCCVLCSPRTWVEPGSGRLQVLNIVIGSGAHCDPMPHGKLGRFLQAR